MNALKKWSKKSRLSFIIFAVFLSLFLFLSGQICQSHAASARPAQKEIETYPATPEGVVEAFCIEDFNGAGTSSETWKRIQQYTTWLDGPGWDTVLIVNSFKIMETKQNLKDAEVKVMYKAIGELINTFHEKVEDKIVTFKLVKEGDKWKITEPQTYPHISVETAIKGIQMTINYYEKNKEKYKADKRARIRVENKKRLWNL
jgi:hypothetical protein